MATSEPRDYSITASGVIESPENQEKSTVKTFRNSKNKKTERIFPKSVRVHYREGCTYKKTVPEISHKLQFSSSS